MTDGFADELHDGARAAWARFIAAVEPLRPALARYCRRLTGDVWDAEDLAHDTLLRGFGLLAQSARSGAHGPICCASRPTSGSTRSGAGFWKRRCLKTQRSRPTGWPRRRRRAAPWSATPAR